MGAVSRVGDGERDRPLPKQKKPGFLDNLCLYTDILCKNPVSEPPGGLGGAIAMYATSDKSIGKVLTTLTVTNRANQSAAARGFIPTEQIRSITLDHVLVDQGATTLCLPDVAIAIPAKTQQPIAIGLSFSFSTKGDRASTDSILLHFQIHPFAMYTAMPPVILIHNLLK